MCEQIIEQIVAATTLMLNTRMFVILESIYNLMGSADE